MTQLNAKVGDVVARTQYKYHDGEWQIVPLSLCVVTKITPKRIYIGSNYYTLDGRHAMRFGTEHLSDNPIFIQELQDKIGARRKEQAERERVQQEKENRPTFQLAMRIVTQTIIADLELLGEAYLQKIIDDIANEKEVAKCI